MTSGTEMRRVLASVTLAALVLSLVSPLLAGGATDDGCPLAPKTGSPASVLTAGMDGGGCEHMDAGVCLTGLGCVTVAPAIQPAAAFLVTSTRLIVLGAAPTPQVGGLYRTGPPTPPPNQI
jgi:hypothetical protein